MGGSVEITEQKKAQAKCRDQEKENLKIKQSELAEREKRIAAQEDRFATVLAMFSLAHDLKNHLLPLGFLMEILENMPIQDKSSDEKMIHLQNFLEIKKIEKIADQKYALTIKENAENITHKIAAFALE